MEKDKNSFLFMDSWITLFQSMPSQEAGDLIKAVCDFSTGKQAEIENPLVLAMFNLIKKQMEENKENYKAKCEKQAEYGKMGSEKRWGKTQKQEKSKENSDSIAKDSYPIQKDSYPINSDRVEWHKEEEEEEEEEEDKEEVEEVPTVPKKREARKRSSTPSVDEVREYCFERGNGVDAETFVDFYASKGWKVGNAPMKDWKAAVRTWEKRDNRAAPRAKQIDTNDYLLGIIEGGSAS